MPPTRRGIGFAIGASAGARRRAVRVGRELEHAPCHRLERAPRPASATIDSAPCSMLPVYCAFDANAAGLRPAEVAIAREPLAVQHEERDRRRREEDRRRIPADRNPALDLARARRFRMSTIATVLLSALATSIVVPSGDSARLFGVVPTGASGYSATEICSFACARREVDHPDRVRVRARDEQPRAVLRQQHRVGMPADRPPRRAAPACRPQTSAPSPRPRATRTASCRQRDSDARVRLGRER